MFKRDAALSDIWVKGEVSNFRPHYSGHMYFTLKDESSAIRCVMFRSAASRMRFMLENGMKAIVFGSVSVFERDGQYQLYCEEIRSDGVGDLYIAFEQMKARLEAEGLFEAARKRPLPLIPRAVCVLTSPTGSVVHDIINVATRRFPKAVIKVFPVKVQGEGAAGQVARAVEIVNARQLADVIIVARGGGSIEELWPFNEEVVARAVAASGVPVISAVGHETDFTICDFAADVRAPTPSAAA
jgi:exodeoxyribonuclease VII large subunit